MEVDALGLRRRVDLHRHVDEPEGDRAVPDRAGRHASVATRLSVQEDRDLLDGRALGHALLLARLAEVQQADRQLVVGQIRRPRGRRAPRARAPCASSRRARARARRAARCRRRPRSRARPRGPARRRRSAWRWRRSASARGRACRRSRACAASAAALSRASALGPSTRKRHGSVTWWFGRPAGELEQLEQDVVAGTGSGPNALCVRRERIRSSIAVVFTPAMLRGRAPPPAPSRRPGPGRRGRRP